METKSPAKTTYFVAYVAPGIFQRSGLSPHAKIVAVCLLMHKNRTTGLCYLTHDLLAMECEVSRATIIRALDELRDRGLITWESRKAPRGKAKGRANSYNLAGLEALCSKPVIRAADLTVAPVLHREVAPVQRHASDFRPITVNSSIDKITLASQPTAGEGSTSMTVSDEGPAVTIEAREVSSMLHHSARTAQSGPLAGLTPKQIREQMLAPGGTSAFDVCTEVEGYSAAEYAIARAGGEGFNPAALSELCDECGADRVWFEAQWFLRRLASRKTPPAKPAALFIKAVRDSYDVNPEWPEFCRYRHGLLTDEERATMPAIDAPAQEWAQWMSRFDWQVDDLPPQAHDAINHDMLKREPWVAAWLRSTYDRQLAA